MFENFIWLQQLLIVLNPEFTSPAIPHPEGIDLILTTSGYLSQSKINAAVLFSSYVQEKEHIRRISLIVNKLLWIVSRHSSSGGGLAK
jgi:hypothetical protein